MHQVRSIRQRLGKSQADLAKALQCSQSNISFYEVRKQTVPPQVARRLIDYAASMGLALSFDHVYGALPLPAIEKRATDGAVTRRDLRPHDCDQIWPDLANESSQTQTKEAV